MAARSAARGRSAGSLDRHAAINGRTPGGSPLSTGGSCTTRKSSACVEPSPNGPRPVAANVSTEPSEKMSDGSPTSRPTACSGDMKAGVPSTVPVTVSAVPLSSSRALEIPKSMTRGPSSRSSTFDGFRSRCTSPMPWNACSASASPAASCRNAASSSGPCAATCSASEGPGTY